MSQEELKLRSDLGDALDAIDFWVQRVNRFTHASWWTRLKWLFMGVR